MAVQQVRYKQSLPQKPLWTPPDWLVGEEKGSAMIPSAQEPSAFAYFSPFLQSSHSQADLDSVLTPARHPEIPEHEYQGEDRLPIIF